MTTRTQPQIQRLGDESPDSPLPDVVDPVLFKGVSFDDGGVTHCAVDTSLAYSSLYPHWLLQRHQFWIVILLVAKLLLIHNLNILLLLLVIYHLFTSLI